MDDRDGGGERGYNRPRRPDPQTIAYLHGLSLDIQLARHEIQEFLEGGSGFPQSFAAAVSAIDEVRMEVASLAGDEYGSQCVEILTRIAAPYSELASRILLHACSGYHLHLATHRYGSHVVQTILQLAVSSSAPKEAEDSGKDLSRAGGHDLALYEDSPPISTTTESSSSLPSLSDLIHGIVEELAPHSSQLAIHVCGSHVLRTLLCVLGGVDLVPFRGVNNNASAVETGAILRGKKKNKKKKRKKNDGMDNDPSSNSSRSDGTKIVYRAKSRVTPHEFAGSLESLALALLGEPKDQPGELQQLSCHSSAGPLFVVLLRVLTYSADAARGGLLEKEQREDTNSSIYRFTKLVKCKVRMNG